MATVPRAAEALAARLLLDAESRTAFLAALSEGRSARPALLWRDARPDPAPFPVQTPVPPWQPLFVDSLPPDTGERPGRHPLHGAGAYYVLDQSSVFEASALWEAVPETPGLVVDVCASPGGKSLFAWRTVHPAALVSNEVIGKRLGALTGNLQRFQVIGSQVTRLDPRVLAETLPGQADGVIVDAPCSGQSLLARGVDNPGCFHEVNVRKNAGRQRRIIAESVGLVAPGGWLLYSTCTYSRDEDEGVVRWLLEHFPAFQAVELPHHGAHRSPHAEFPCYRLWPQEGWGAGGFVALLRNNEVVSVRHAIDFSQLPTVWEMSPAKDTIEP